MTHQLQRLAMLCVTGAFIGILGFSCAAGMTVAGGNVDRSIELHVNSHNTTMTPQGDGFARGVAKGVALGAAGLIAAVVGTALFVSWATRMEDY